MFLLKILPLIPNLFWEISAWVIASLYCFGIIYFPYRDYKARKIPYLGALVLHIGLPLGIGSFLVSQYPLRDWITCTSCNKKQEWKAACKNCNAKLPSLKNYKV